MAREIKDIKQSMTASFMTNETIINAYGLETGDVFESVFSTASIENCLLDVVATGINDLEQLTDQAEAAWLEMLAMKKAHSPRWYQAKGLEYLEDVLLIDGTDVFDIADMTEAEILAAKVVKFCAVETSEDSSEVTIKIAGLSGTTKQPLPLETEAKVLDYFAQIKDAGVKIRLVNIEPYRITFDADVYFDALLNASDVQVAVKTAAENYMNNLPFNGEFSNMALVDAIQAVPGVVVVEHKWSKVFNNEDIFIQVIDGVFIPLPGYLEMNDDVTVNMLPHVS
jgi:hypothetical protein